MDSKEIRMSCTSCGWVGLDADRLESGNPFSPHSGDLIFGCPECYDVGLFEVLCDVKDCTNTPSMGKPTKVGYKRLCSSHADVFGDSI